MWHMETRSQVRAKVGRSPGSPDGVLENPVSRPSSEISETDEDLGLTTLLGDGEALVVERGRAVDSATSGPSSHGTGPRQGTSDSIFKVTAHCS